MTNDFYSTNMFDFYFSNATTPTYLTTDGGGTVKRIFTSPVVSTVGGGATTLNPSVSMVSNIPFGTPAAITGGRPPSAILTAAGVTNLQPTSIGTNNLKQECNGGTNQQAVIVQQPPVTLFNNSNGHPHPIVNFSSSPSITLIPASSASVTSTNSPVNLSGVTVTPTPLPTLSSSGTTNNTMTASRVATAIVMPTQPTVAANPNSIQTINSAPMSSVTVSLSSNTSDKLQQISAQHPAQLPKMPSSVVSISPSPAVTVVPASTEASSFQIGSATARNNNFSSVEVRPIKENDQPDSKRPRLETTHQTE